MSESATFICQCGRELTLDPEGNYPQHTLPKATHLTCGQGALSNYRFSDGVHYRIMAKTTPETEAEAARGRAAAREEMRQATEEVLGGGRAIDAVDARIEKMEAILNQNLAYLRKTIAKYEAQMEEAKKAMDVRNEEARAADERYEKRAQAHLEAAENQNRILGKLLQCLETWGRR